MLAGGLNRLHSMNLYGYCIGWGGGGAFLTPSRVNTQLGVTYEIPNIHSNSVPVN
jgi:hypothetical protein